MYTNQTILVIGGMLLITFLILTFYNSSNSQIESSANNEAVIEASSIGKSLIEEICLKKFDQNVQEGTVTPVNGMSTALGTDGEIGVENYNDIDDFNGYTRSDTLANLGVFNTDVTVNYVSSSDFDVIVFSKTYYKRIDVTITNESEHLTDSLKLFYIAAY